MKRFVLYFNVLLWLFGCGGGGGGGPTPPATIPDIAGTWSGTTIVHNPGSGTQCTEAIVEGTFTGQQFTVTQDRQRIEILELENCVICQFTGTIAADGSFTATGTLPPVSLRVVGQVTGNRMTARKGPPTGVDCDLIADYDLTRG